MRYSQLTLAKVEVMQVALQVQLWPSGAWRHLMAAVNWQQCDAMLCAQDMAPNSGFLACLLLCAHGGHIAAVQSPACPQLAACPCPHAHSPFPGPDLQPLQHGQLSSGCQALEAHLHMIDTCRVMHSTPETWRRHLSGIITACAARHDL